MEKTQEILDALETAVHAADAAANTLVTLANAIEIAKATTDTFLADGDISDVSDAIDIAEETTHTALATALKAVRTARGDTQ